MTADEVWDELLPSLADVFESGKVNLYVDVGPLFPETFETVRETLDQKVAEGSLVAFEGLLLYRFTTDGYKNYKPRVDALRRLRSFERCKGSQKVPSKSSRKNALYSVQ